MTDMTVSGVQTPVKKTKTVRNIGTAAGFAGYTLNVLKKEGKDVFSSAAKEAVENKLNPKFGVAVKVASIVFLSSVCAIGGRIIGSFIDKAIDKYKAHKAEKHAEKAE